MNEIVLSSSVSRQQNEHKKITLYSPYLKYALSNGNIVRSRNARDVDRIRHLAWTILKAFFFSGHNFNKKVFLGKPLFVSGALKC